MSSSDLCARPTCEHTRVHHSTLSGCLVQQGPGYCSCQEFMEQVVQPYDDTRLREAVDGARDAFLSRPETPYAGTSGWSGSDTSRERAQTEDDDGTTHARQARALEFLIRRGVRGATWKELAEATGQHHGQASGVLSVLHKVGRVARLNDRRERCAIYVAPGYVAGRETAEHGRKAREVTCPSCDHTFSA